MTQPRLVSRALLALVFVVAAVALVPTAPAAAEPPVAGPQTSGDTQFPNVGNGGYDVLDYEVDIVWSPATIPVVTQQSIDARTTITATTTGAPLSSFSLDFRGLEVTSVTVNDTAAAFSRVQDAASITYKLVITPAAPVEGTFTTVVEYEGTPESHTDLDGSSEGWIETTDGATFVNQPVGSMTGFPNNNTPQDKATYTFKLNVPTTINLGPAAAVANGVLTSKEAVAGNRTLWVWDVAKPMPSFLSLISIGRYDMFTSDITLASGTVVKEWSFVDPTASAAASFAATRAKIKPNLDFLEARYGAYPGNSTGLVVDNTLASVSYALETQDRPFFPGSVADRTLTHELMHMWFGNNVSPEFWSDLWVSEGAASYSEDQYADEAGTETTFFEEWEGTAADSATWTTPAADPADDDSSDLFGTHVYDRGAMALEALRTAVGPTAFLALMKEWQDRYAGTSRGTEDFFALAEEVSGKELTAFFDDWIYQGDKPDWPGRFALSLSSTPASGVVAPGATVDYTLSAENTGKVALVGKAVTLDLTDVLDDATIAGPLPAGASLAGSTLTWDVPSTALGATSTLTLPLTLDADVTSATLTAVAAVPATTLGGTCGACTSTLGAGLPALAPSADPTIAGTAQVGRTLTAVTTGWASGTTFTHQWKRNGTAIPGANARTYPLVVGDLGAAITVTVTGSKSGTSPVTRTSAPTGSVAKGRLAKPPAPSIRGKAEVGRTLRAVPGSRPAGVSLRYQWYVGSQAVRGATGATFKVRKVHRGERVHVKVVHTKPGYQSRRARSPRTAVVV